MRGVYAPIVPPRMTDRGPHNPSAARTTSTAPADLRERQGADADDRFGGRPCGSRDHEHLGSQRFARAFGRVVKRVVRLATRGAAGRIDRRRTVVVDRGAGEGIASAMKQTAQISWSRGYDGDVVPDSSFPVRGIWPWPSGCGGTSTTESPTDWFALARILGAPKTAFACGRAEGCRGRMGLQIGKPRRASGDAVRPRTVIATDSRAEQGLEVASALPKNDRGARTRGDARTASREGKALKGGHR